MIARPIHSRRPAPGAIDAPRLVFFTAGISCPLEVVLGVMTSRTAKRNRALRRKALGQAEAAVDFWREKGCDRFDPCAAERQHVEHQGREARAPLVPRVAPDCELAVRPGLDVPPAMGPEQPAIERADRGTP